MKLVDEELTKQIVAKLISVTEDSRFYIYKTSDDMFKIEHSFFFESEIEQLIYTNLIANPFIVGEL